MWVVLSQHGKAFVFTRPVFRMQILLTQSQLIGQLEIALELPTIFNPILTFRCQNCTVQQKGRKKGTLASSHSVVLYPTAAAPAHDGNSCREMIKVTFWWS